MMGTVKDQIQRRRRQTVKDDLAEVLPTSVQKSYFMLSDAERTVLNTALEKYRAGQSEPILEGGTKMLKPALRLMTWYRLKIEEVIDGRAATSYTRWVDAVRVRGAENQEVYLTFSPRFEHIWLESKRRLLEPKASQYWTAQPVCPASLRLGEDVWLGRNLAHYIRATSHSARAGFESLEQADHGRVTALILAIKARTVSKGKPTS